MNMICISGRNLSIEEVIAVVNGAPVTIDPTAVSVMERTRQAVVDLVQAGTVAYGITTGFGRFKDCIISAEQTAELQVNLVRSHAVGVGVPLSSRHVRSLMLARANTLAMGHSGVRPCVVQRLVDFLNRGIHPRIPSQGSLGASGDLAPLAHMALVMIGEGEAEVGGRLLTGAEVHQQAGWEPLALEAKEGLALLNGTAFMVGLGALAVVRAVHLVETADIAAALTLEALHGTDRAYDERVHALRPHPRQIECAAFLRRLLEGSGFLRKDDPNNVQDPYTLRCVPQVHGALRDAVAYARWVIEIELNSANDNPLILIDEKSGKPDVISAGNFHGEPIALAMDYLKLAIAEIGNMSERRIARMVDADCNQDVLPMFLTEHGGIESGFMLAQYTAAALASENKVLAHPASVDSIPSSANVEDHVSMGPIAVRHAERILEHTETIVAIELLCAAQGIDFRRKVLGPDIPLGRGTGAAYRLIRESVPFLDRDRVLAPWMDTLRVLVLEGKIRDAAMNATA